MNSHTACTRRNRQSIPDETGDAIYKFRQSENSSQIISFMFRSGDHIRCWEMLRLSTDMWNEILFSCEWQSYVQLSVCGNLCGESKSFRSRLWGNQDLHRAIACYSQKMIMIRFLSINFGYSTLQRAHSHASRDIRTSHIAASLSISIVYSQRFSSQFIRFRSAYSTLSHSQ